MRSVPYLSKVYMSWADVFILRLRPIKVKQQMGLPKCLKCGKYENRCPQLLICWEQETQPLKLEVRNYHKIH